ncbi:phage integrase N-terminal SAM-like domain-containing protein [Marinobacter sp. F4216]|uniref:phage integrase N-terminal SAM-like domain-containing protein n=1 Tax=Marinobacter sp. F4216 TaxID=2874281 RepID=UPI001CBB300A|nr:phage integrase N-terminal SAM-like domain-containing protein [Marinobacter sp. F4216]MBZ2169328.1 phage integrase N-terminal SAM-like domain-containing protein [Marinobacter sp. F4216]
MSKSPFLESIRREIRTRQYSYRTEKTYLFWVRQFILFNDIRTTEIYTHIIGDRRAGTVSPFDRLLND